MNMERTAGLILKGQITNDQIEKIPKDFNGDIIVNGDIKCDGLCEIPGSLWLYGNMEANTIKVAGDLNLLAPNSYIIARNGEIGVSGDFILRGSCDLYAPGDINVGGDLEGKGLITALNLNVYNRCIFFGEISLGEGVIHAGELNIDAKISNCGGIKSGW